MLTRLIRFEMCACVVCRVRAPPTERSLEQWCSKTLLWTRGFLGCVLGRVTRPIVVFMCGLNGLSSSEHSGNYSRLFGNALCFLARLGKS
jgi:hypothetical protein